MSSTQLTGNLTIAAQKLYSSSSTALHNFGELVYSNDGRAFRYVQAGSTALVSGKLQQAQAEDTSDQNITPTAAAIGDSSVVTSSTMTVAANQYANGYMIVTVTPGVGKVYKISGHSAYAAAAATFTLADSIEVALTTTSRVDFVANPYGSAVVNPTSATSVPIGVAIHPIEASYFGWLQIRGVAPILADGAITVGNRVQSSTNTAGAVMGSTTGSAAIVGISVTGVATTEYGAISINLP